MSRLTRDGTAEPVSRDQILRHARGQGNVHFPCSADHEQDWQPYPVDPYSAICDDHTYIHTYTCSVLSLQLRREITATQRIAHMSIKCQSRSWSQRGTKVNGSHAGTFNMPTSYQKWNADQSSKYSKVPSKTQNQ